MLCWFASVMSDSLWPYSSLGSSVHGILQARILEWIAMPSSRGSFQLRNWTCVSCTGWQAASLPLCHLRSLYSVRKKCIVQFSSVAQSCLTLCDPMDCSTPGFPVHHQTPGACWNSCPLSLWCHPTISSSVVPFSSCLQSFPASGSFPVSQFFTSGGQRIGVSASASVLPMNIQNWFPLGLTGWISLLFEGLSRVFSNNPWQYKNKGQK